MKTRQFTEAQIAFALQQADSGTPVGDIVRKMGISEATFYLWKKKYAGPNRMLKRAGSRLGRSALFVHGLGVSFALVAATVLYLARIDYASENSFVLMAVGGGAFLVCSVWSVVLAVRAVRARELLLLPALVGLIFWAEFSGILVGLWFAGYTEWRMFSVLTVFKMMADMAFGLALPVLLPVTLVAAVLACAFSRGIVRRIEARRLGQGMVTWTEPFRTRVKSSAFAACLTLSMLLLLPVPLVLYCASVSSYHGPDASVLNPSTGFYHPWEDGQRRDWFAGLVYATPEFLLTFSERLAHAVPFGMTDRARGAIVRFQVLSADRLAAIASDGTDPLQSVAFIALQKRNPELAAEFVRRAWLQGAAMNNGAGLAYLHMMDPDVARLLLDDLASLCESGWASQSQSTAFMLYVTVAPEDQVRNIVERWARSRMLADRRKFYKQFCIWLRNRELFLEYVLPGLNERDPLTESVVLNTLISRLGSDPGAGLVAGHEVLNRCLKLLENSHPAVRMLAARLILQTKLVEVTSADMKALDALPCIGPNAPVPPGWQPPPVYGAIRAAAEQWLKEHGE